jgi:hypothetical protein
MESIKVKGHWKCSDCIYDNPFDQKGCVMCGAPCREAKREKPSRRPLRQIDANESLHLALPSSPVCQKDPPEFLKVATVSAQLVRPAALHDVSSVGTAFQNLPAADDSFTANDAQRQKKQKTSAGQWRIH